MKIYVSGPLIVVSDRQKTHEFFEFLAQVCIECGHQPYLPHQNSDPVLHKNLSYKEVFEKDFTNLLSSEKILAVIDEPSTGVGAEIGIALEKGIEVVAVYNVNSQPSRFILGLLENSDNGVIIRYSNQDDCKEKLEKVLIRNKVESSLFT